MILSFPLCLAVLGKIVSLVRGDYRLQWHLVSRGLQIMYQIAYKVLAQIWLSNGLIPFELGPFVNFALNHLAATALRFQ